jgi:type IV pilus assembly protein PilA
MEPSDAGFTLIELMVVLLIIAILLAIAIPTFLGVSGSANDRAAQSNLTNALTEAKALYQNSQTYCESTCAAGVTALPVATILSSAPEFAWTNAAVTPGNGISIQPVDVTTTAGTGDGVIIAAMSKNANTCWYAVDLESQPNAAFTDTAPNYDFAQAQTAAGPGQWESAGSVGKITAGVFYAKSTIGGGGSNPTAAQGCSAGYPVGTPAGAPTTWNWGTTFSNAPAL